MQVRGKISGVCPKPVQTPESLNICKQLQYTRVLNILTCKLMVVFLVPYETQWRVARSDPNLLFVKYTNQLCENLTLYLQPRK